MKSTLILLFVSICFVSLAQNAPSIYTANSAVVTEGMAADEFAIVNQLAPDYYLRLGYGCIPEFMLDELRPYLGVVNQGSSLQEDVQLQLSIDGAVVALSSPQDFFPGMTDTLTLVTPISLTPGYYTVDLTVISQSEDLDLTDNTIQRPFEVSEFDLGKDHGEANGYYPSEPSEGEQFLAVYYVLPEALTSYGLRVALAGGINGSDVEVRVYDQNFNQLVSGSTLLNTQMLNQGDESIQDIQWFDVAFDEPFVAEANELYLVGVYSDQSSQLQVVTATSYESFEGVYVENGVSNWQPDDLVMMRMSFDPAFQSSQDWGCTDPLACNYDSELIVDEGPCFYPPQYYGCDDECLNDSDGDGICDELEIGGCTNEEAINFDPEATDDDGSCEYPVYGCTNQYYLEYNPEATIDDGSCLVSLNAGTFVLSDNEDNDSLWFSLENLVSGELDICCMYPNWDLFYVYNWGLDSCYNVTLYSENGDGWGDASLQIYSYGELLLDTTLVDGYSMNFYINAGGFCDPFEYDGPMYELTEEETVEYLLLAPNPVIDVATVQARGLELEDPVSINVFDLFGRLVYSHSDYTNDSGELRSTFNLGHLRSGVYELIVIQNDRKLSQRLIKE